MSFCFLREKPGDSEWVELLELKIPLLMNLAQCRLKSGDYYEAITHTSEVIEHRPDNVKVLCFVELLQKSFTYSVELCVCSYCFLVFGPR